MEEAIKRIYIGVNSIKHKRDKPLYSIEEICKMNGVNYDTLHPSDCIMVKDSDGKIYKIDSSFNIFEKVDKSKGETVIAVMGENK